MAETIMVPRDQRIQRAYRDTRPMAKRSREELDKLAADLRLRGEDGKGTRDWSKSELAAALEAEAPKYVPTRSMLMQGAGVDVPAELAGGEQ